MESIQLKQILLTNMAKIIEKDGKRYLITDDDKAIPINENGQIKVESEEIEHEDGSKDVIVKVPCLKVKQEQKDI